MKTNLKKLLSPYFYENLLIAFLRFFLIRPFFFLFKNWKKPFQIETYENLLVKLLHFFMKRNPICVWFVFSGLTKNNFKSLSQKEKSVKDKLKSFNSRHPFLSASSSFLFYLLILGGVSYFLISHYAQPTSAAWWNDDWHYRKLMIVTNNTTTENNVYVSMTIDTSGTGKFQADCGDLRFTNLGGKLLEYYIVSGCGTSSTSIHVNFEIFSSGAQTIFYYYGNPSASNGFSSSDFSTEASNYTIGTIGAQETGPGPVGYWSFDEGYGTTAHGYPSGSPDFSLSADSWQEGVSGTAIDGFNGMTMTAPDQDSLDLSDNITISFWYFPRKYHTAYAYSPINKQSNISDCNFNLYEFGDYQGNGNNGKYLWYANAGGTWKSVSRPWTVPELNRWYFLTWTYSSSTGGLFYVNGSSLGSAVGSGALATNSSNISSTLGGSKSSMDELKIYPYVRTPDQIKQDYNAGLAGAKASSGTAVSIGDKSDKWLTDGLVGYWKMDEVSWNGTSGEVIDASGNGNHGTAGGGATTGVGKFGNSGNMNGSSGYAKVDSTIVNNPTALTISSWFKKQGEGSTYECVLHQGSDTSIGNSSYWMGVDLDDNFTVTIGARTGVGWSAGQTSVKPILGDWNHLLASWDGSVVKIYINGEYIKQYALTTYSSLATPTRVGSSADGTTYQFNGNIDEVRIYNRAFSADEVKDLYQYAPGPVAYWKMDEGSGTTVNDVSGNGNNGTLINSPTWAQGKYGGALDFGTTEKYVEINDNDLWHFGSKNLSVSFWSFPRSVGSYRSIVYQGEDGSNQELFDIEHNSGKIRWLIRNTSGSVLDIYTTENLPLNQWTHVEAVRSDSSFKIYFNGIEKASGTSASSIDNFDYPLFLGTRKNLGSAYNFDGLIDDVKIYNYAHTQKQILENMNAKDKSALGGNFNLKNPLVHWSFDEGYGTIVYDSSGYGKNLTLSDATNRTLKGKFGSAYRGGDNQRAYDDGDDDNLDFSADESFSITGWFKRNENSSTFEYLICKENENEGYAVYLDTSGDINFCIGDTSSVAFREDCAGDMANDFADDQWHHFAAIKTSNEKIEIYIDKNKIETKAPLGADGTLENSGTLYIGDANDTNDTDEFQGYLDEIKIYSYALDFQEIAVDYNRGKMVVMGSSSSISDSSSAIFDNSRFGEYFPPGSTSLGSEDRVILHYKFDEKNGSTVYDSIGTGYNGIFETQETSPTWDSGKFGGGLFFDGVNDYVELPINLNINIYGRSIYALAGWFRLDSSKTDECVVYTERNVNNNTPFASLQVNDEGMAGVVTFSQRDKNNVRADVTCDSGVDDGFWHHFNVNRNENLFELYVDGVMCDSKTQALGSLTINNAKVGAAEGTSGLNNFFHGWIDEIRIYKNFRTPAQVAWDYNRGKPVGWWSFNEGEGATAHNEMSDSLHGILNNMESADWQNGHFGGGLDFDGSDEYVSIGDTNLNINAVSFWLYTDSSTEEVIDLDGGAHTVTVSSGEITAGGFSSPTIYVDGVADATIATGNWHHVLVKTATAFEVSALNIGKVSTGYFDGKLDEVKIFNYQLTIEQVRADMNGGALNFQ